ncbi:MAG: hypothetical protein NTZ53_13960 [Cyanobacteria bacterium]|nr:hypothetical protein [Cyanobacteriota bacterium]
MSSISDAGEALGALELMDHPEGCRIYREANGQLLVAVNQRPEEYWVAESLPVAHALCRRLQSLRIG